MWQQQGQDDYAAYSLNDDIGAYGGHAAVPAPARPGEGGRRGCWSLPSPRNVPLPRVAAGLPAPAALGSLPAQQLTFSLLLDIHAAATGAKQRPVQQPQPHSVLAAAALAPQYGGPSQVSVVSPGTRASILRDVDGFVMSLPLGTTPGEPLALARQ